MNKALFIIGRAGIGFVFIYFGITTILSPEMFSGLVPDFIGNIFSPTLLVTVHGIVEAICGALLVIGIGRKVPIVLLCLTLLPVIFLVSDMTRIRDIGIFSALLILLSNHMRTVQLPKTEIQQKITM
jgi:uncharacterized membrane protein YphA (DoxX/SURF4 family)